MNLTTGDTSLVLHCELHSVFSQMFKNIKVTTCVEERLNELFSSYTAMQLADRVFGGKFQSETKDMRYHNGSWILRGDEPLCKRVALIMMEMFKTELVVSESALKGVYVRKVLFNAWDTIRLMEVSPVPHTLIPTSIISATRAALETSKQVEYDKYTTNLAGCMFIAMLGKYKINVINVNLNELRTLFRTPETYNEIIQLFNSKERADKFIDKFVIAFNQTIHYG